MLKDISPQSRPEALSCVDGSFYARVNLSDFDVCRLRSCVRPFDAVDITAGLDEVRTLGPNQTRELVSPDNTLGALRACRKASGSRRLFSPLALQSRNYSRADHWV